MYIYIYRTQKLNLELSFGTESSEKKICLVI